MVLKELDVVGILPGEEFAIVRPDLAGPGAARRKDPDTAKAAAKLVDGEGMRVDVLEALDQLREATAPEIAEHLRIERDSVSNRLSELRRIGLVTLTGETRPSTKNRPCQVNKLTPTGEDVCEQRRNGRP
jgi:DNA-binding transcriptional ArsR family regulator